LFLSDDGSFKGTTVYELIKGNNKLKIKIPSSKLVIGLEALKDKSDDAKLQAAIATFKKYSGWKTGVMVEDIS